MDRVYPAPTLLGRFMDDLLPWPTSDRAYLVLDLHPGYALMTAPLVTRPCLIVTRNRCPLYLKDLWRCQPEGIIAFSNTYNLEQIAQALAKVAAGKRVCIGLPPDNTGLTARERDIARLAALGRDDPEIARELHITEKTVRNLFPGILLKMGLKNRVQLSHYYLGILPVFPGGPPAGTGY